MRRFLVLWQKLPQRVRSVTSMPRRSRSVRQGWEDSTGGCVRSAMMGGQTADSTDKVHRDESGLTTLEWLLIVAAVAGLAALAVVLVTRVVGDTAEQIGRGDTRETAARLAADEITQDALREAKAIRDQINDDSSLSGNVDSASPTNAKNTALQSRLELLNQQYQRKCENLGILYSDLEGTTFNWRPGMKRTYNTFKDKTGTQTIAGKTVPRAVECGVSS